MSTTPFDDIRELIHKPVEPDTASAGEVREALLGMGREGDFGQLGDAAAWLAQWQGRYPPRVENPTLAMFAGAHGLTGAGVSLSDDSDTRAQVEALRQGRAPLSAIAAQVGANIRVFELAIEKPTPNIAEAAAMSEADCVATMAYGFEALEGLPDLLSIGVIGAGIGTAAAAVACALYGGSADYWVRPGPATPSVITRKRTELVNTALSLHRGHTEDPLEALARLGGREMAACAGAIVAARQQGIPVLLDGFATTIAAGVIHAVDPDAISHVVAAHATGRPAHQAALERLDLKPLVEFGFSTGGGLGSATAIGILKTACAPFLAKPMDAAS
ncbi:MAG: nicotinate-nucleotide--dimethylbenzimidazole phosphoribosyltransferase [Alphaproteobacteria bacterium]|jgi:nicotinate-nucleotide--dimethylbenzimidazole phosphoribosyltransferase|nr:nicotinate-nucleotide--dimethylbenzimidazole phosphoribosyltransferase [Alphaproteobacteria bacterium]